MSTDNAIASPNLWQHHETSGGKRDPILFELFWAKLPNGVPELIAGHGQMLSALLTKQYQHLGSLHQTAPKIL